MSTPEPTAPLPVPPIGVKVTTDLEHRASGIRARARWIDPHTRKRVTRALVVPDEDAAEEFFQYLQASAELGIDKRILFSDYVEMIGDRWQRGLDPTSTVDGYKLGLRLRVLPALGHLPLSQITAGMIDRTIDQWETLHSASTIKNTIAPLVRVLDEAVRDDLLPSNPARNRSRRSLGKSALNLKENELSPRVHALKDLAELTALADRCGEVHQSYSDFVMLCALLAARGSEISGLQVGDIDWDQRIVTVRRQTYPGAGGLVTKQTKGRDIRQVPILQALTPVLERLTADREPEERLLTGPRGGVLTTASVRDATKWDQLVTDLELTSLTRHGLRHTGATWLADAGIPLHVLQGILGHKSIETTRGYLHPDTRHLTDAAARANAFLDGQETPTREPPAKTHRTAAPGR
ncbi:site-specific integrase [Microbacterium sp. Se5.02b]|uniref:tyrosine-type recombinase/integrase n=1 Tax=unclassified Microbacterium TaxID=2609290 RepID=UPI00160559E0|nr:site-specific integrase [Microbacterium sp. Se5.02b]QNA93010.1 site-specific integrase [Microbacterium sp. Se63.02b]QYM63180.1 site-specific integrase [Microbacterium sp. Se5.02b]